MSIDRRRAVSLIVAAGLIALTTFPAFADGPARKPPAGGNAWMSASSRPSPYLAETEKNLARVFRNGSANSSLLSNESSDLFNRHPPGSARRAIKTIRR